MQYFSDRSVNPWFRDEMRKLMKIFAAKYNRWCHTKNSQSNQLIAAKLVVRTYRNSKKTLSVQMKFWLKIIIRESITQNLISLFLLLFGSILYYQLLYNFYYILYTICHIHEIPLMHVNQPRFHSFVHFRQIVAVCEKLTLSGSD